MESEIGHWPLAKFTHDFKWQSRADIILFQIFEILAELSGKSIAHPLPIKVKQVKVDKVQATKTVQPKATDDCAKEMFCKA